MTSQKTDIPKRKLVCIGCYSTVSKDNFAIKSIFGFFCTACCTSCTNCDIPVPDPSKDLKCNDDIQYGLVKIRKDRVLCCDCN